jgi:hypothetical protein
MSEYKNRTSLIGRPISIEIERVVLRDPPPSGVSREGLARMIEEALRQHIEQQGSPVEFVPGGGTDIAATQSTSTRGREGNISASQDQQTARTVAGGIYQALGQMRGLHARHGCQSANAADGDNGTLQLRRRATVDRAG